MPCSHLPPTDVPDPLRVGERHFTETVLLLARGIAADLAFDRMPILADALEDAGCANFTLLHHLRADDPHRVECWALRRLLRTTLTLPGGVPLTLAYCPPGAFAMSSSTRETAYDERPVHRVTLTAGFHAGVHPVTQRQWQAVMGTSPSRSAGEGRPVERVRWEDAGEFCRRVARSTGVGVRLPSEAEWEYACRAGTATEYHWGDEPAADRLNCHPRGGWGVPREDQPPARETTPVGSYPPNPWGLSDCHGNVWEWCRDVYDPAFYSRSPPVDPVCETGDPNQRVVRGGSFENWPHLCRSASRYSASLTTASPFIGFRVVFTA